MKQKKTARDQTVEALKKRMRGLINELEQLVAKDDPRWRAFGLNIPALPNVPDVPQNVTVNNGIPGRLLVTCAPAAGAAYYRFWTQEAGTATEPTVAGTAQEPTFLVENLTAGKSYKVFVSAVNGSAGESELSAPATAQAA